jgi:hypothetical protein
MFDSAHLMNNDIKFVLVIISKYVGIKSVKKLRKVGLHHVKLTNLGKFNHKTFFPF